MDELKLSETSSSSDSGSSDSDDEDDNPNTAKKHPEGPDAKETGNPGLATVMGTPVILAGSENPGGPEPEVVPKQNPS